MNHNLRLLFLILAVASLLVPVVHAQTQVAYTFTNGEVQTTAFQLNPDEISILYPSGGVSATLAGPITGTGTLWKQNWGTITLTGANDYSGDTTIMTGTLVLGVDNAIPFNAGKTLSVSGGTLDLGAHTLSVDKLYFSNGGITATTGHIDVATSFWFNADVNFAPTVPLAFGGTASMKVSGNPGGQLTLTGENTFSGGTTIDHNGVLQIGNNGTSGSIVGNVVDNGTLAISRSDNITFSGDISGSGDFTKRGDGTLTLTGNNTYTGTTYVYTGTLALGSDLTSPTNFISYGGTIDVGSHNISINGIFVRRGTVTGTTGVITVANWIQSNTGTSTISAIIAGAAGITMNTTGNLILTRDNTFTGATNVSAGTLSVNGSTSASSVVTVSGTGTLGGSGTIGGATTIQSGGTLAPGNSPGLLTFGGDLTLNSGSTSAFQIDGTDRGTTYDAVNVAGTTTFGGTLALDFSTTIADGNVLNLFGGTGTKTGDFDYITATGSYSGSFTDNNGYWTLVSGGQTLAFSTATGNLAFGVSAVPEPSTYAALAGLAALGLAFIRRRRTQSAA